jgi:hypothetical protein
MNLNGQLRDELSSAEFGDQRLTRRLCTLAETMLAAPDKSFPMASGEDAALEGTYRFLNNESVTPKQILAPHWRATAVRCSSLTTVLVAHDTTEFNFGVFERDGLGMVAQGKSYGFYGHFSLALAPTSHEPLGVLALQTIFRHGAKRKRAERRKLQGDPANEATRWLTAIVETEERLQGSAHAIHVMDRESDNYLLLAELVQRGHRFVARMKYNRVLENSDAPTVRAAISGAPVMAEREVPLTRRRKGDTPAERKRYPQRKSRIAKLQFTAEEITLPRSQSSNSSPLENLPLHLVRVQEVEAPEGEEPVEWLLWTTEPIDSAEQILAVVDAYRGRWVIEEYFKSLKTGCAYEERQLESAPALLNALAVLVPVAWRLLLLRSLARGEPSAPAQTVLTKVQIICLRGAMKRIHKRELPARLTALDAMLAVAKLGMHLGKGPPGWIVLGRGLDKLLTIELGYYITTEDIQ